MGVNQFSFGDGDAGIGSKEKPWKADKDRIYRLGFLWFKGLEDGKPDMDLPAPQFAGGDSNWVDGVGHVINKGPEYTKLAGGDAPRKRIVTIIMIYPTTRNGDIDKAALIRGEIEVFPWVISGDKFSNLKNVNKEFPFGSHDCMAACSDAQYQKLVFTPCKDSFFRALTNNPKTAHILESVIAKGQAILASIQDHVGKEMSIQQLRDKLAGVTGGGNRGSAPMVSQADTISAGDIDSMVDSMLDI